MSAGAHARGRVAEAAARDALASAGFTVIESNFRVRGSELDVVCRDDTGLAFVEVRSRTGESKGHPLEAVTAHKRAQVVRAARLFLDSERPAAIAYRFDVVAVTFWPDGRDPELAYVPDAFSAG